MTRSFFMDVRFSLACALAIAALGAILLFPGCLKNGTGSLIAFESDQFPLEVGDTWTYEVFDSTAQRTDTMEFRVLSHRGNFAYKIVTMERRSWRFGILRFEVSRALDTVRFDYGHLYPNRMVFPLVMGRDWKPDDSFPYGNLKVEAIEELSVPAGAFSGVYRIDERTFIPNDDTRRTCWVARNVGILKAEYRNLFTLDNSVQRETWTLIFYSTGYPRE